MWSDILVNLLTCRFHTGLFRTITWCTTCVGTWWSISSWSLWATSSCFCRHHHLGCQCGPFYCTNVHAEYIYQISLQYVHYMLQVETWPYVRTVPILTEFTYSKCLYMYMYSTHWSRTLCTTYVPDVELEVSLLVDGVFLLGVSGLPADVGVDIITWVVSVVPFTVQVYM